jgi:hypothetical protein
VGPGTIRGTLGSATGAVLSLELPRISLLGRSVNKGKKDKKGRGIVTQILASSKRHQVGLRKLEEPRASPVLLCLSSNG